MPSAVGTCSSHSSQLTVSPVLCDCVVLAVLSLLQSGDSQFEPVGQHYHAISPDDESLTSAHELIHFKNLFECVTVDSLDELFSLGNTPTAPPVPDGWAQRVKAALLDIESSEDHMNGILQNALKEADGLRGLDAEEKGRTKQRKEKSRKRKGADSVCCRRCKTKGNSPSQGKRMTVLQSVL